VNGNTLTLSGIVSGAANLVKDGVGTLALTNAANTYSGTTTISAGTLTASAGSLGGTSDITVNGATLTANNFKFGCKLNRRLIGYRFDFYHG
jgi:autotransporter-associated beta strand protein